MSNLPASKPKPATQDPDQSSTANEPGSVYPDPRTSWANRAWVAVGSITVFLSLVKSKAGAVASQIWVKPILAGVIGYLLADFISGLYHWAINNYWDTTSPIIGNQVDYFQKHHKWPSLILKYKFSNLLRSLGRGVTCTILPIILIVEDPTLIAFVGSLSGFLMFSLQFHAWAHANPSKLPKIVVGLQNMGVLVSQSNHAAHHRAPINSSYCLVSGFWNKLLDENKVFMKLENLVFSQFGVKPRSWKNEPNSEGIEESYTPS